MNKLPSLLVALVLTVLVGACAQPVKEPLPEPLRPTAHVEQRTPAEQTLFSRENAGPTSLTRSNTPAAPGSASVVASGLDADTGLPPLKGEPVNVNIEGVPLPAFINEFFGTILGVSFQIDPAIAKLNDLVTLRTAGPQSPANFYRLAVQVLHTYGVATSYEGGRVLFTPVTKGGDYEPPLVLSGRALPNVPVTHRPIFQLVELQAVRVADVTSWLRVAFKSDDLQVQEDLNRNAVVLYGKPDIVQQAASAIRVFDRPYMRGRASVRLEPAFVGAEELSKRLVDVLSAEGYGASLNPGGTAVQAAAVIVLPMIAANAVIVFAADPTVLEHAVEWSRTIDKPNPAGGSGSLFYYLVQNTRAEDIAKTLNGVRSASPQTGQGNLPSNIQTAPTALQSVPGQAMVPGVAVATQPSGGAAAGTEVDSGGNLAGGKLVLDAPRNALIFQGAAADWSRLLPLIKQMDKAARQVMIEVTIAEVSLDDNEEFGVSWLAKDSHGKFDGRITSGRLGGSAGGSAGNAFSGLTYLLDVAGQARAQLRAYAEDNRVTVLSTPRLLVKSGEEASIDVGTEVPTITAQTASSQQNNGDSNILQSVQYRKTGIILNVKPVVYSDNRIDLEISQEVSEALPLGASDAVQSPSIFNRSVTTSLSLHDGSSVLLGGLISRHGTDVNGGVPLLKDVPVLGNLFKSRSRRNNKTELVLMIVPYIVESDEQATALTHSLSNRYELLDVPTEQVVVPVTPSQPVNP